MALLYTEEQKELIEAARDVAENQIKPHVAAADEAGETPDELWKYGFDLGLHFVGVPEEFGGLGLGLRNLCHDVRGACKGRRRIRRHLRDELRRIPQHPPEGHAQNRLSTSST